MKVNFSLFSFYFLGIIRNIGKWLNLASMNINFLLGRHADERSQGATEYLLMLGAVLAVLAGIVAVITATSWSLGSNVSGKIESTRKEVIDRLIGIS